MKFKEYILWRAEKFGSSELKRFKEIEENLFEYDSYLALNMTAVLSNVQFRLVASNNGKYYYKDC